MMERICKPHIVDLLRISDQRRWLWPRIRYASIRSKPTLLGDLRQHFRESVVNGVLELFPRNVRLKLPRIQYNFRRKCFLFDGLPIDVPKVSRKRIRFEISAGPVTVTF